MRRFFGGYAPGQREMTRRGIKTEVWIPVVLCIVAVIAGLIAAFVIQRRTVSIYQGIINATHFNFLVGVYKVQGWILYSAALLVPLKALFAASIANVYDQNYPPTHTPTTDQLVAPWFIRWLTGATGGAAEAEEQQTILAGRAPSIPVEQQPLDITIRLQRDTDGGKQTTIHAPKLTMAHWNACARLADAGKTFSTLNLRKPGGLSNNAARYVNSQLREHRLIPKGKGRAVAAPEVVAWLKARGYIHNKPFPTPKTV